MQTRTERERAVVRTFGLTAETGVRHLHQDVEVLSHGLVYITGFSGSGKSCLLREIARSIHYQEPAVAQNEEKSLLECFTGEVGEVIQWLGHFGLSEAKLLLTPVRFLSVGQRERLRLALLLREKPKVIILDEFLASLDRITARNIAFQFQKLVRRFGITAYVATAHDDLGEALAPDQLLRLDFEGRLTSQSSEAPAIIPDMSEVVIEAGTLADYHELRRFHYMDSPKEDHLHEREIVRVQRARFRGQTVGVRLFVKLYPTSFEKIGIFEFINQKAVKSSRVTVHPAFRGLGLPALLDWQLEFDSNKQIVFSESAMALYFPFNIKTYKKTDHPSLNKTDLHLRFERFLLEHGLGDVDQLGEVAEKFWSALNESARQTLRDLLVDLLSDYDQRHFEYICQHLNLNLPPTALDKTRSFFLNQNRRTPENQIPKLLHEGLYFPMQGMIKKRI
jgi:ABC-type lipoprotein export system ATPase subunit/GNAT superfamily N-acetyltransferase